MPQLDFNVQINAPREKVWDALWKDQNYNKWTSVFSEGSHARSDWEEGSEILFLDGKGTGMYSVIERKVPNEEMIFKHLGEVIDGKNVEKDWAGAKESYYLNDANGGTALKVTLDINAEFADMFREIFPKGLNIVKEIAEQ